MTELNQVYKCSICGNIVEILHTGVGTLVCCGKPMEFQVERTEKDEYKEKHVPVASKTDAGLKVVVGSVLHPMKEEHYIEWVEVLYGGNVIRKTLKPGDAPEVLFDETPDTGAVRAYCNLHGLWRANDSPAK